MRKQATIALCLLTVFCSHPVPRVALGVSRKSEIPSFLLLPLVSFSSHATQPCVVLRFPLHSDVTFPPLLPTQASATSPERDSFTDTESGYHTYASPAAQLGHAES